VKAVPKYTTERRKRPTTSSGASGKKNSSGTIRTANGVRRTT